MSNENFPRRSQLTLLTPAETAIHVALIEVEKVGADSRLTDAIVLLQQAREKVADYLDERLLNTL
jgi:uncharacterized Zn finger protein